MVAFIPEAHYCIFFCYAIKAQAAQLAISDRLPTILCNRCHRHIDVIFPIDQVVSDGVERVSCNIDKVDFFLRALGHPFGEARQFLLDVFFESSTSPPSHLSNLGIQVTRQREGIGTATSKSDRDAFCRRVFNDRSRRLQCFAHIFVGNVATLTLVIAVSREEGF
jgi:hypothetical protein